MAQDPPKDRLEWVDVAKGICIILAVMMHSTPGVEKAIGAQTSLNAFIAWARPFRIISGLFLPDPCCCSLSPSPLPRW
jgi:uncharacterized membrane protein YcfT